MDKKRNKELVEIAQKVLKEQNILLSKDCTILDSYNGQVASLSVSVAMLGLVPTLAVFYQDKPNDNEKKAEIVKRFSAIACEMEGGAIAQVCYVNKVPFSILRVISDGGDDNSHLDYAEFKKFASDRSVKIIESFVKSYEK